jgi:NAD(P)-dependent dehydrogenase (short-subunit alcohol dehydrogenase family)
MCTSIGKTAAMERITSAFGWGSTALEVVSDIDLSGKRAIVTGAASGLGVETARALAAAGAAVTLAVRDLTAGGAVAADISASTGADVSVSQLDLSDPHSIQKCAQRWSGPLHILVNNAGIMATPFTLNDRGQEVQFATNHLGHFMLANLLHPALAAGAPSRIVSVSSVGHRRSPVIFDDINFTSRPYDKWAAYGQSKTANILFAVGATQQWSADGITANALHPGGIMTNLQRHMDPDEFKVMGWIREDGTLRVGFKNVEQGAATSALVATSALLDGIGGRYFEDCNQAEPASSENRSGGVEPYALDPDSAAQLWTLSMQMSPVL